MARIIIDLTLRTFQELKMKNEVKERSIVSDFIIRVIEAFFPSAYNGYNGTENKKINH